MNVFLKKFFKIVFIFSIIIGSNLQPLESAQKAKIRDFIGGNNSVFCSDPNKNGSFFIAVTDKSSVTAQIFYTDGSSTNIDKIGEVPSSGDIFFWVRNRDNPLFATFLNSPSKSLQIYSASATSVTKVGSAISITGLAASSIFWADDNHLIVADKNLANLQLYYFDGTSTPKASGSIFSTASINKSGGKVYILPGCRGLLVGGKGQNAMKVYSLTIASSGISVGAKASYDDAPAVIAAAPAAQPNPPIINSIQLSPQVMSGTIKLQQAPVSGGMINLNQPAATNPNNYPVLGQKSTLQSDKNSAAENANNSNANSGLNSSENNATSSQNSSSENYLDTAAEISGSSE